MVLRWLAVLTVAAFAQEPAVLFDQAVAKLDAGKPGEAYALLSRIAEREPNELGTRAYLVKAAVAMDDALAARTHLAVLRKLAPRDAGLHAQLAEWCAAGRNVELGSEQLQFAFFLEQPPLQKARLLYLRGTLSVRSGAREWGMADLRRAMGMDPGNALYVVTLATLQGVESPKQIDAALLREGLRRFPKSPDLLVLSALREMDAGNANAARAYAASLEAVAPGATLTHEVAGRMALSDLQFDAALAAFTRAIQAEANNAAAHHYLGLTLRKLGRDASALAEFVVAVRLAPENASYHFEYGRALFENGKPAEARGELQRTIQLAPQHASAHFVLAGVERKLGNAEAARGLLAKYRELSPE